MSREIRRSLVAKEVINLTTDDIWTYGTSGMVVKLKKAKTVSPRELIFKPGVYYIVTKEVRDAILAEHMISEDYLLEACYTGMGRGDVPIYHFFNHCGAKVIPITEQISAVSNKFGFLIQPA